eukprot:g3430.t1
MTPTSSSWRRYIRVIKTEEESDVLKNLLNRDTINGICYGFACFNDQKHTIMQLSDGIDNIKDQIDMLCREFTVTLHMRQM